VLVHAKKAAPLRRNQNSEDLAQRRKGRKEIKLPNLAFFASWREQSRRTFSVSLFSPDRGDVSSGGDIEEGLLHQF
jgi:hypothetical protein